MPPVTSSSTRFTVAEYFKMARGGVFGVFGDRRVELINGRIYRMSPQNDPHMLAMSNAIEAIGPVAPKSDWVIFQGTLRVDKHSAPESDVLWLPVPKGTPSAKWPLPVLIIEVSDTSYKKDSGVKLRKYAERGVCDYWIVNIAADRIEVYRDPKNPTGLPVDCRYQSVQHYTRGQKIAMLQRPKINLAVDDLLP